MKYSIKQGFTLVELISAIIISTLLLGGIFYFITDTLVITARSGSQANFLQDFYSFSSILKTGKFEVTHTDGYDVGILKSFDGKQGILLGAVNQDTLKLVPVDDFGKYIPAVIGYRSLTQTDIQNIETDNTIAYNYEFFPDKLFNGFYLYDLEMQQYNTGSITELELEIFPQYYDKFADESWGELSKEEVFEYSLIF